MERSQYLAILQDLADLTSRLTALAPLMDSDNESIAYAAFIDSDSIRDEIRAIERQIDQFEYEQNPNHP